jgi:CheY-like chemotaxis protein
MVEDNAVNQIIGAEQLASLGYEVTVAANGHEGLQRARAQRYDAVLMDMQMPLMDGLEATRRIRQLPGWAEVPIIAMTANAFAEDRDACVAAGMNDHLSKPVLSEALSEVLQRWLPAAPVHRESQVNAALPRPQPVALVSAPATQALAVDAVDAADAADAEDFLTRTRIVHSLLASADALAFELAGELKDRVPAHLSSPLRDRIGHLLESMEVFDAPTAARMLHQVLPDLEREIR